MSKNSIAHGDTSIRGPVEEVLIVRLSQKYGGLPHRCRCEARAVTRARIILLCERFKRTVAVSEH